jgi:ferredoxin
MTDFEIAFEGSDKDPVKLEAGTCLSENLTLENSPILFGCRIGICGTCTIDVVENTGEQLHPRTPEESEYLEALAEGCNSLRLACQIRLNANIRVRKVNIP